MKQSHDRIRDQTAGDVVRDIYVRRHVQLRSPVRSHLSSTQATHRPFLRTLPGTGKVLSLTCWQDRIFKQLKIQTIKNQIDTSPQRIDPLTTHFVYRSSYYAIVTFSCVTQIGIYITELQCLGNLEKSEGRNTCNLCYRWNLFVSIIMRTLTRKTHQAIPHIVKSPTHQSIGIRNRHTSSLHENFRKREYQWRH